MEQLPSHVAPLDEPMHDLGDDPHAGPDLREVMPVAEMLADLATMTGEPDEYAWQWRDHLEASGGNVMLQIDHDGNDILTIGYPCDAQVRHRNRYLHFLREDLRADDRRRDSLVALLMRVGRYVDQRPAAPRETTIAIRDYLRTEGRILIDPEGCLRTGGGLPKRWVNGSEDDRRVIGQASKAYTRASRKAGADIHIKRVVRMLGERTSNGWMVLEARS